MENVLEKLRSIHVYATVEEFIRAFRSADLLPDVRSYPTVIVDAVRIFLDDHRPGYKITKVLSMCRETDDEVDGMMMDALWDAIYECEMVGEHEMHDYVDNFYSSLHWFASSGSDGYVGVLTNDYGVSCIDLFVLEKERNNKA